MLTFCEESTFSSTQYATQDFAKAPFTWDTVKALEEVINEVDLKILDDDE